MKVTMLNVYVNKTSPKYIEIIKLEVSPRAILFVEADILKELKSVYVRSEYLSGVTQLILIICFFKFYSLVFKFLLKLMVT